MEDRLIGYEEPTKEDVAAIKEYEASKKNGKLTLAPLGASAKAVSHFRETVNTCREEGFKLIEDMQQLDI